MKILGDALRVADFQRIEGAKKDFLETGVIELLIWGDSNNAKGFPGFPLHTALFGLIFSGAVGMVES